MKNAMCRLVGLLILMSAGQCFGQTVTGTLSGRVTDATGAVIADVAITARNQETGLVREAKTNSEGYYNFTFVPLGSYEVSAVQNGFKPMKRAGLVVSLNRTTVSDFRLAPAGAEVVVSVTGEAPLINTESGEVKNTLDSKAIDDRPLPTRNFLVLAETVPGFQDNPTSGQNNPTMSSGSSLNFNGAGTRGTTFQINGVNNDDSSENQNRQNVNVSSIAEVQVLTNNFSAEFGRGFGSVVLVQTKNGTNAIHGDVFYDHINSALQANDFFNNAAKPKTKIPVRRRHDYGFTAGGPLKKDKLFYFGSFEQVKNGGFRSFSRSVLLPTERQVDASVTSAADRAWIQSVIDRFPSVLPNNPTACSGPSGGNPAPPCRVYNTTVKYHWPAEDYSGRMDWNIDSKNTLTGRYQYSHQSMATDDVIIGEQTGQNNRQQNLGLTLTHVFSNTQTGELRFGLGRRRTMVDIAGGNDIPIIRFSLPNSSPIIGNAGGFPIHRFQTDWQYVYNHFWQALPTLTLKFGTDVRISQLNDLADNYTRGYWSFTNDGWVNGEYHDGIWNFLHGRMTGSSFTVGYGPKYNGNRNKEANFYVQADWKVRPDLTLNFGFRDEYVRAPREVKDLIDYGYDDDNAVTPRFGFAYTPKWEDGLLARLTGGPGQTSIRGGFGMFSGRIFQSLFSSGGASLRFNPPNAAYLSFTGSANTSVADPMGGYVFTPGPATARVSLTKVDPNLKLPYTEQWNLTVERQLPSETALTVAYVGNRGIGLPFMNVENRAQFPFTAPKGMFANDPMKKFEGVTFDCIDPNLTASTPISPAPGHQCISISQPYTNARRPDPRYSNIYVIRNASWSYYNALQVSVRKRPTHGLSLQAGYTFGKSLDTGSDASTMDYDTNIPILMNDTAASMKGYSTFDTRHRFTLNWGYELPLLKAQKGAMGKAFGGWQLTGTFLWATGNPFTVSAGYDMNADGVTNDRAYVLDTSVYGSSVNDGHYIPGTTCTLTPKACQSSQAQLNVLAFYPNYIEQPSKANYPFYPGIYNASNQGRNMFRAAGRNVWDMTFGKTFKVAEGKTLSFRMEGYNIFNHAQFNFPTASATSTSFGRIGSVRDNRGWGTEGWGGQRTFQAALRYKF